MLDREYPILKDNLFLWIDFVDSIISYYKKSSDKTNNPTIIVIEEVVLYMIEQFCLSKGTFITNIQIITSDKTILADFEHNHDMDIIKLEILGEIIYSNKNSNKIIDNSGKLLHSLEALQRNYKNLAVH